MRRRKIEDARQKITHLKAYRKDVLLRHCPGNRYFPSKLWEKDGQRHDEIIEGLTFQDL